MRKFSFLLSVILLCSNGEAAGTLPETLEGLYDATGEPMRVQVVRRGRAECEPICAEWISAEGMMEQGSAQRFNIVVDSLHGRKLPVLIHSHGGVVLEAMLIGTLIRARGLDVAVVRTERDPCSNAPQGCKLGRWSGVLGRPSLETAQCFSACTFVLAGGLHRFAGAKAQIGLTSFRFPKSQVDIWRKEYGGKTPFEDVIRLHMIPARKPWIVSYFKRMGISAELTDRMYSIPLPDISVLSEDEFLSMRLLTDTQAGESLIEQLAN